jgi:hypothetical protein
MTRVAVGVVPKVVNVFVLRPESRSAKPLGLSSQCEKVVVSTQPNFAARRLRDQRVGHELFGTPFHTRQVTLRR